LRVACGCNSRRIAEGFLPRHASGEKNSVISWPNASSNVANLHSLLPLSRFPVYPSAFHREHHNRVCHRLEKHLSNTAWLVELVPDKLAALPRFVLLPHPSSKHSGWPDPPRSGCRFRFFLAQVCVQFIQFRGFGFRWHRSRRQFGTVLLDPIGDALRVDLQDPPNGAIAIAFDIHANG